MNKALPAIGMLAAVAVLTSCSSSQHASKEHLLESTQSGVLRPLPCPDDRKARLTTAGQEGCLGRAIRITTRQIKIQRNQVRRQLDHRGKTLFSRAEAAWARYRVSACTSEADVYRGGSEAPVEFASCILAHERAHLRELRTALQLHSMGRAHVPLPPSIDFRIVVGKRIGPYHYLESSATYLKAISLFGAPSGRQHRYHGNLCTVRWNRWGMRLTFVARPAPCAPRHVQRGHWYIGSFTSRRWRTARGLRVGDSAVQMRRLYPEASTHVGPGDTGVTLASVSRDGGRQDTLTAVLSNNGRPEPRIVALELFYPGAF